MLAVLYLAAVAFHGAWATTVLQPLDWDPAYYRDVGRSIAAGLGAQSGALWHRLGPDLDLPMLADLHWMPLPSRLLVPGLWLWPAHGDAVVTVIVAAAWGPLAAVLAGRLGGVRSVQWAAGLLGVLGGGYVRFLSTPDSIALYGILAGLGWLMADRGNVALTALLAGLLALTRGDGFLMAPCLALVLRGPPLPRLAVAAAGPVVWLGWQVRGLLEVGPAVLQTRRAMASAVHIDEVLTGVVAGARVGMRALVVVQELGEAIQTALVVGIFMLPLAALGGAWRLRRAPLVRGVLAYAVLMPVVTLCLAPAIAASGTPFRSGAALYIPSCALAALGVGRLGAWGHRVRGYPRFLLLGGFVAAMAVGTVGFGQAMVRARPGPLVDCDVVKDLPDGAVVFTGRPLELRGTCGVMAVLMRADDTPEGLRTQAARHGVAWAILPAQDPDPTVATDNDGERLLPGWSAVAPGLWARPD